MKTLAKKELKLIKYIKNRYERGFSVNLMIVGRARTGKSLYALYLMKMITDYMIENNIDIESRMSMGLDLKLFKEENKVILLDDIGAEIYRGFGEEYENKDKLYKILLTSQMQHFVLILTTNFVNDIEVIRRFLDFVIEVRRINLDGRDYLFVKVWRIYQMNITGRVIAKTVLRYKIPFDIILKFYKAHFEAIYSEIKKKFVAKMLSEKTKPSLL
ncbi:MAG: hypothetical protein QXP91_10640 [Candidatus Methanomethylicia archaeon]